MNRCLRQVLHFVKKDDAVSPVVLTRVDEEHAFAPEDEAESGATSDFPSGRRGDDDKPRGERDRLVWAMEQCGWVQAKAARLLNITPRQMGYALKKHDIEVRRF